jgi:hypothetical protein
MADQLDTSFELTQVLKVELAEILRVRDLRSQRNEKGGHKLKIGTGDPRKSAVAQKTEEVKANVEPADKPEPKLIDPEWEKTIKAAHEANLTALCFSGGGIRSATFNLGVLQALAELKLLHRFDYLSTVSGGGYIGGWLAAWIARTKSFAHVQHRLGHSRVYQDENKEPTQIRFLRMFSNYLTPKIGGFSPDTWAMVSVYLRNMLLNLVVLLAAFSAVMLVPHLLLSVLELTVNQDICWLSWAIAAAIFVLVACSITFRNMGLIDGSWTAEWESFTKPWVIYVGVCIPLLILCFIAAIWAGHSLDRFNAFTWAIAGSVSFAGIWLLALLLALALGRAYGTPNANANPKIYSSQWKGKWAKTSLITVASALAAGAAAGALFAVIGKWISTWHGPAVIAFGMPLMLVVLLVCGTLHMGLMGIDFREAKREWWARAAGLMMLSGLCWSMLFAIALLAPGYVNSGGLEGVWKHILSWKVLTPTWVVTTISGVLAGKSTASGTPGSEDWRDVVAQIAPYVFIVGLLCSISWSLDAILHSYDVQFDCILSSLAQSDARLTCVLILLGICIFVGTLMSLRVDINQFSMHMFYRNRLVRCYLGASNLDRDPNLFTGFCESDDVALKDLVANPLKSPAAPKSSCEQAPQPIPPPDKADLTVDTKCGYDGPYPVLNASLNLVKGKDLAWQQRKAESFVMTPQFCGYDVWLEEQDSPISIEERDDSPEGMSSAKIEMDCAIPRMRHKNAAAPDPNAEKARMTDSDGFDRFGFRPTRCYAFPPPAMVGPKLGLAMAISGAAASPNMGFYSTPAVGFLMTVFDVRLGQWLGNPRHHKKWMRPTPAWGLTYLLKELLGGTDDNSSYVYLSDGGHFENMGLYEMVKRRAGLIVVCDVEADPDYKFAGLGNAIRKCRIDLGVDIQLDITPIVPDKITNLCKAHCAVGTIHYENADLEAPTGTIIYVKASLAGDEPTDVKNYSKTCPAFPHESTVDQWFTETQFESYRSLGYHIISSSFRTPPNAPPVSPTKTHAKLDVKFGDKPPVPVDLNITFETQLTTPGGVAAVLPASQPPASTAPGPGGIPFTPALWTSAADTSKLPIYTQVATALCNFSFDLSVAAPAYAAERNPQEKECGGA